MAVNTRAKEKNDSGIEYKIISNIGILAEYSSGWKKELNIVVWNNNQPKFDIRDWSEDHTHMSRGVTLHEAEALKLFEHLSNHFDRTGVFSAMRSKEREGSVSAVEANSDGCGGDTFMLELEQDAYVSKKNGDSERNEDNECNEHVKNR